MFVKMYNTQMDSPLIIYEDNHLLIVQKPPCFLSQKDSSARPDMLTWAAQYRQKPGRAYVGLVHRLDHKVGGVLALAKTSKAASRLSFQFRQRSVEKRYLALIDQKPLADSGYLQANLCRLGDKTHLAGEGEKGTDARLQWFYQRVCGPYFLLEINLLTGFKHQIRAQLAALGWPVLGDGKYGSPHLLRRGEAIGLWAHSLAFNHPTTGERLTFTAPLPTEWLLA